MTSKLVAAVLIAGMGAVAQTQVRDRPDRLERQTMQQAIAFEKHKQAAADRQAQIERQKNNTHSADRQDQRRAKANRR